MTRSIFLLLPIAGLVFVSVSAAGQTRDTSEQEATCKSIGFRPKTVAFGDCVLKLLARTNGVTAPRTTIASVPPRARPAAVALTPNEQTCSDYGFKRKTSSFSQCLMEIDQAQQQAQLDHQQYQLQVQQYDQQLAAYQAQEEAIRKEKKRRQSQAMLRMGLGMMASNSPYFAGAVGDGFRAMNGQPPLPPPLAPAPPALENITVRMPNGNQVYCSYNSMSGYMSCR